MKKIKGGDDGNISEVNPDKVEEVIASLFQGTSIGNIQKNEIYENILKENYYRVNNPGNLDEYAKQYDITVSDDNNMITFNNKLSVQRNLGSGTWDTQFKVFMQPVFIDGQSLVPKVPKDRKVVDGGGRNPWLDHVRRVQAQANNTKARKNKPMSWKEAMQAASKTYKR